MYSSSEKKLEILNDHYKDTFSQLVRYRKQRDRLLLYALAGVTLLLLYQFFPNLTIDVIFDAASKRLDVAMDLDFIDKILLVMTPIIVFFFVVSHRYWQIWNLIDSQYDYLEKLEQELASLYASGVPFTRESKFSNKGKALSIWNSDYYNDVFRAILKVVLPALGLTFGIRHFGFKMPYLVMTVIFLIAFLSPWIWKKVEKRWADDEGNLPGRVWGFVVGIFIAVVVATTLLEWFFPTLF